MDDSASATDLESQATAISDGIAAMHREHYGRGADRTRTLIHQDVVMTRLEDCFTTVEKRMIAEGRVSASARDANDVPGLDATSLYGDRGGRDRPQGGGILLAGLARP